MVSPKVITSTVIYELYYGVKTNKASHRHPDLWKVQRVDPGI